LKYIDGLLHG
jgi:hypothetical protein